MGAKNQISYELKISVFRISNFYKHPLYTIKARRRKFS